MWRSFGRWSDVSSGRPSRRRDVSSGNSSRSSGWGEETRRQPEGAVQKVMQYYLCIKLELNILAVKERWYDGHLNKQL